MWILRYVPARNHTPIDARPRVEAKEFCMNRVSLVSVLVWMTACAGGTPAIDGVALAKEVCTCTEKANKMKGDDPNRAAAQKQCNDMHTKAWDTVKGTDQADPYNANFPCG